MAEDLRLIGKLTLDTSQTTDELAKLQKKLEELKTLQGQFVTAFGEGAPEVKALTQSIADLEKQISSSAAGVQELTQNLQGIEVPAVEIPVSIGEIAPIDAGEVPPVEIPVTVAEIPPIEAGAVEPVEIPVIVQDVPAIEVPTVEPVQIGVEVAEVPPIDVPEVEPIIIESNADEVATDLGDAIASVNSPIQTLKQSIVDTQVEMAKAVRVFGEGSPEVEALVSKISLLESAVQTLPQPVQEFNNEIGNSANSADKLADNLASIKAPPIANEIQGIKQQLAGAEEEFQKIVAQFGALSPQAVKAAEGVAKIKSEVIASEKLVDSLTRQGRFQTFSNAINGAAGAFTALQGAQALFGKQSEDLQKTLVKVQGALALSQGLQSVLDAGDAFKALGISAKNALAGIRTGIAATGIGVLLIALGAIVAYWDDIKELVSGVSSEQEKLNELGKENLKAQEDKIAAIEGQEQQLRAQGKSEKEILQIKLQQTDEAIRAAEVNLENARATKKAQVEAAERNREILKGLINFVSLPITAILAGVDLLTEKLNKIGVISDETFGKVGNLRDKFTGGIANLVFDPEKTAKEGDEAIDEADKALNKLKEKRAGFQNSIAGIDKAAGEKARAEAKKLADEIEKDETERQKRRLAQQAETEKLTQQNRLNAITDASVKERQIIEEGYQAQIDALLKNKDDEETLLKQSLAKGLITQEEYNAELITLQDLTNAQRLQIDADYQAKLLAQAKAAQEKKKQIESETGDIEFEARLSGLEEGQEKETLILERAQQKRIDAQRALLEKGEIDQAEFDKRRLALEAQFQNERDALTEKFGNENLEKQITALEKQIDADDVAFQAKKDAIKKLQELNEQGFADGLISREEYEDKLKEIDDKRTEIELQIIEERQKRVQDVFKTIEQAVGFYQSLIDNQIQKVEQRQVKEAKVQEQLLKDKKINQEQYEKNIAAISDKADKERIKLQKRQIIADKAVSIANIVINTLAANAKFNVNPGFPASIPLIAYNSIQGALGVATTIAQAAKALKELGGGGSAGDSSSGASLGGAGGGGEAPLSPQPETTTINQEQVNQLGTATNTVRAYVVEQDVSDSQSRANRLERAVRIS